MEKLTCIKRDQDIKPAYKSLSEKVNEIWYGERLFGDTDLFLEELDTWYDDDSDCVTS